MSSAPPSRAVARLLAALWVVLAAVLAAPAFAAPVEAVASVGMTVSQMDRSVRFYTEVLSFRKVSDAEVTGPEWEHLEGLFGLRMRAVRLALGDETIELRQYLAPRGRPIPDDARSNDRFFQHVAIIVRDMDRAYAWLRRHDVEHASSGPQRLPDWNKAAGGIEAFYFKDPDGHPLEILHFPLGKGDPRWCRPGDDLFLGIDHTAIVVSDTARSLAFYRDVLGLRVAGESENYGTEQEHLNNVFGARLRITSLRAAAGPGVEFLEYLAPRDGRPYPPDARANDLVWWDTTLVARDAEETAARLRGAGAAFVSPGVVSVPAEGPGALKGFLVHDPDGHVLRVSESAAAAR